MSKDTAELIAFLEEKARHFLEVGMIIAEDYQKAASRLSALQEQNDRLREALKPFVDALNEHDRLLEKFGSSPLELKDEWPASENWMQPPILGDWRRARSALSENEG